MQSSKSGSAEFIVLAAMMMSLVALCIDAMLPALPAIHRDFTLTDENDRQLVITMLFLGLSLGQLFFGPLSDATGRKPAIYLGFACFIFGSVLCIFAPTFTWMLVGRFAQGVGAASPRIVMTAIIRDRFEGDAMARVMSFIMTVFILVPAVAPLLGQGLLVLGSWRLIFIVILAVGVVALVWFALRQPETLALEARRSLSGTQLAQGIAFIAKQPQSVVAVVVTGMMFGSFVGYLSSSQQIFVDVYGLGAEFPLYFGVLALAIGMASLVNARLVMRIGMIRLCFAAMVMQVSLCVVAQLIFRGLFDGAPPLWAFMAFCLPLFFVVGLQFGNLNALAMQPLGKLAGLGASVVGAVSTVLAVILGMLVGHAFDGTVMPVSMGFLIYGAIALVVFGVVLVRPLALKTQREHL